MLDMKFVRENPELVKENTKSCPWWIRSSNWTSVVGLP